MSTKGHMNCNHCMISASPTGQHMNVDVFKETLNFINQINPILILVSGGEPTEHPGIITILESLLKNFSHEQIILVSNGMFLNNKELVNQINSLNILVQITNDSRYYPIKISESDCRILKNGCYVDRVTLMTPLGRALDNNLTGTRQAPLCFNLRSVATKSTTFKESVKTLESHQKFCSPSINTDGSISVGESNTCYKIGTVEDSDSKLFNNLLNIKCNKCKLFNNLSNEYRKVVGE